MDRQQPRTTSGTIDLYIRTYYSLLRSSGPVRVRAFEEAHLFSDSSLHAGARAPEPDVAAFAYSAARLPDCMPGIKHLVLGQSKEQFEGAGYAVRDWQRVSTRGRRRPIRWDGGDTLACFITSSSDIDDLVPIVTAYQIEWNKLYELVSRGQTLNDEALATLGDVFGNRINSCLASLAAAPVDLSMRLLSGSFVEYQRAAHRWWSEIEPHYVPAGAHHRRPVYIVCSNTHALVNLLGGFARENFPVMRAYAHDRNPEGLATRVEAAVTANDDVEVANLSYYLLHKYLNDDNRQERRRKVQAFDAESGITTIPSPGHIDVSAQLFEMQKLKPERFDPRLRRPDLERLKDSDAVIVNIDYPLGMAGYHHLSRLAQATGEVLGIYVMGKAATLNARVGDVMVSGAAYDEHSGNTYLFNNCFRAVHIQPFVTQATVLDGQKALSVRGSFLQNREYMGVYYREGYTVLEMEAGPYLSAIYEIVNPKRHPKDEIVHLSTMTPFDFGLLHYASDTPYSRRQSLLSKSLSYFGVDATYGCAAAIASRILQRELARLFAQENP